MDNKQLCSEYKLKGEDFVAKITSFAVEKYRDHIAEIAKRFEIPIESELYECDDEALVYMTVDYFLHEHMIDGKTIVEMYEEEVQLEDEFEKEFIQAMKESYVSLYRVVNISKEKSYVFVMDLLNNVRNTRLTDWELSQILDDAKLAFMRIYKLNDINITMNCMYNYDYKYEDFMLKSIKDVLNIGKEEEKIFNVCLSMTSISKFIKEKELLNMI